MIVLELLLKCLSKRRWERESSAFLMRRDEADRASVINSGVMQWIAIAQWLCENEIIIIVSDLPETCKKMRERRNRRLWHLSHILIRWLKTMDGNFLSFSSTAVIAYRVWSLNIVFQLHTSISVCEQRQWSCVVRFTSRREAKRNFLICFGAIPINFSTLCFLALIIC